MNGYRLGFMACPVAAIMAVGIGAGLVLQSAFMQTLDLFAKARGQDYLKALTALSCKLRAEGLPAFLRNAATRLLHQAVILS